MNIIEFVKSTLESFPRISEVCNEIHVDFTDESPENYGLSSTGDSLIKEDVLGNQTRQHTFTLFAVYQSVNDYDRMTNSGVLLDLAYWLETKRGQSIIAAIDGVECAGTLKKLTCNNGMLYNVPNEVADGWMYQLQISAEYKLNV